MWRSLEATKTFRRKAFFEKNDNLIFSKLFNDQTFCKDFITTDVNLTTKGPLGSDVVDDFRFSMRLAFMNGATNTGRHRMSLSSKNQWSANPPC